MIVATTDAIVARDSVRTVARAPLAGLSLAGARRSSVARGEGGHRLLEDVDAFAAPRPRVITSGGLMRTRGE